MQYCMGAILLAIFFLTGAAGCITPSSGPEEVPATPVPIVQPTNESPIVTQSISGMALQLADIPSDYTLKDRSVMISPEVTQLTRDLGWTQGYFVTFDRMGRIRSDQTRIRQSINIFPVENMKKVFNLEKIAIEGGESMMPSPDEVPFPATGDRSIAYRMTDTPEQGQVTYIVIFTRKNVYERITMYGTTTDYETLKDIVQKAAVKVR